VVFLFVVVFVVCYLWFFLWFFIFKIFVQVLACWCKPAKCHCDVLAQMANDLGKDPNTTEKSYLALDVSEKKLQF
jgi:hypothetical protein